MNAPLKLSLFREYHNLLPEDIAAKLSMPLDDYNNLEKGKAKINGHIAQQLADLYQAPIEFFIVDDTPYYYQADVMFSNCTFTGNGANGYVNHQYNDRGMDEVIASKNSEIKTLRQQLEALHQQNSKLLEMVGNKLNGEVLQ